MEQTITANGALFAAHHKRAQKIPRRTEDLPAESPAEPISTFRASVGEFALRRGPVGYELEVNVGNVRRLLGVYVTREAAVLALTNRRTSFEPWDQMGRAAAATQLETIERWDRPPQTS